jgi:hypothetical protein
MNRPGRLQDELRFFGIDGVDCSARHVINGRGFSYSHVAPDQPPERGVDLQDEWITGITPNADSQTHYLGRNAPRPLASSHKATLDQAA